MKPNISIWTLLAMLALFSCNSNPTMRETSASAMIIDDESSNQSKVQKIESPIERKIIKEGEIAFKTAALKETESLITRAVNEMGGYISTDDVYSNENRVTHRMTVKVPADKFDQLLTRISESAEKIDRKTVSALDVTEEYIDIEARIKTKKELENRYKELLDKAKTVQDLLSIEKEIGTLRTEIESIEGRLRYLQNRVNFSTLTIEYYQMTASSFGFFSKLGSAFVTGWNWLLAFIVGLIHMWPFILLIGSGLFIAFRIMRKRKVSKNVS